MNDKIGKFLNKMKEKYATKEQEFDWEQEFDIAQELEKMRASFAQHPYLDKPLPRPRWMTKQDSLSLIYDEYKDLFRMGEIHYAYIVQANELLFRKFPRFDCPANILYSLDDKIDKNPTLLGKYGSLLYSYKNTEDAPENLKEIVAAITDEYERKLNTEMEIELEDGSKTTLYFTTAMIFREHLPKPVLTGTLLPIISAPKWLKSVMVLPKKDWTEPFIRRYW